jgi:hypothetical protein
LVPEHVVQILRSGSTGELRDSTSDCAVFLLHPVPLHCPFGHFQDFLAASDTAASAAKQQPVIKIAAARLTIHQSVIWARATGTAGAVSY